LYHYTRKINGPNKLITWDHTDGTEESILEFEYHSKVDSFVNKAILHDKVPKTSIIHRNLHIFFATKYVASPK
jgi:hypothetical protein